MRRGVALCQSSPCRLLRLLLVLLLGYLGVRTVNGSGPLHDSALDITHIAKAGGKELERSYLLYSECSKRHVQMKLGKNPLNALGENESEYAVMTFKSQPPGHGRIRIFGKVAQKYLCFSKKGRLILRQNPGDKRSRHRDPRHPGHLHDNRTHALTHQCDFMEEIVWNKTTHESTGQIKLRSLANDKWYVGFNKGRKLRGYPRLNHRNNDRCYTFIKVKVDAERKQEERVGPFSTSINNRWPKHPVPKTNR